MRRAARAAAPRRRVLVVGVARPGMRAAAMRRELARSRHDVALRLEPPAPGAGKWANLRARSPRTRRTASTGCWSSTTTSSCPRGFLDRFVPSPSAVGLRLAQPAHRFASHAAWPVTRRRPGSLARRTRFVEIGPVTAVRRDAFGVLLPFPDLQMGWGLDAHWSAVAARAGLALGVVDATPIRHLAPVAGGLPARAAIAEEEAFLRPSW